MPAGSIYITIKLVLTICCQQKCCSIPCEICFFKTNNGNMTIDNCREIIIVIHTFQYLYFTRKITQINREHKNISLSGIVRLMYFGSGRRIRLHSVFPLWGRKNGIRVFAGGMCGHDSNPFQRKKAARPDGRTAFLAAGEGFDLRCGGGRVAGKTCHRHVF